MDRAHFTVLTHRAREIPPWTVLNPPDLDPQSSFFWLPGGHALREAFSRVALFDKRTGSFFLLQNRPQVIVFRVASR